MKIIKKINNMTKVFAKLKNFASRSAQYFSLVNSYLLVVTFLTVRGINFNYFALLGILILIVLVIGSFDYFFVLRHELAHINKRNSIKRDTETILKELEELKNATNNKRNNASV